MADLETSSGTTIPALNMSPHLFLDRTVGIYGASGTGKTVIVTSIMDSLRPFIDQGIVISPSESSNHSYQGFVDPPFIHTRPWIPDPANPKKEDGIKGVLRFLEAIWQRQEMMAALYAKANNPKLLAELFERLPRGVRAEAFKHIATLNHKRKQYGNRLRELHEDDPGLCASKLKEINSKFQRMLVLLYKKYITPYFDQLWELDDLSADLRCCLNYLNFNPRLLLVLDDCAADLKSVFNRETFRKFIYRGRHIFISTILCFQDDSDLSPNLRKNLFVSIFTTAYVCQSNFERLSNNFPKAIKAFIFESLDEIYGDRGHKHRKFAYIREDPRSQHFYVIEVAKPKPFRFGSPAVHELSDAVQTDEANIDKENPYYDRFMAV